MAGVAPPITRYVVRQSGSYRGGIYRPTFYHRTLISLPAGTTVLGSVSAGVGAITVAGSAPNLEKTIAVGSGTVTVAGSVPVANRFQANIAQIMVVRHRRVSVGSGIYRQSVLQRNVYRLTFNPIPVPVTIGVGSGTITIGGNAPIVSPAIARAGVGAITVDGSRPAITADLVLQPSISAAAFQAILSMRKRRLLAARYERAYPPRPESIHTVISVVKPSPSRFIGVPVADHVIEGNAPTILKTIPMGSGDITVAGETLEGYRVVSTGVGEITISGDAPTLEGTSITFSVGAGVITIAGSQASTLFDEATIVSAEDGLILLSGNAATVQTEIDVAAGEGSIEIAGETIEAPAGQAAGAALITIDGEQPVLLMEKAIGVDSGTTWIAGETIALLIPEIVISVGDGGVSVLGASPSNVVVTGVWDQTAGDATSWSNASGSAATWTKRTATSSW